MKTHPHPPISYFFDKKLTDDDKKWLSDPYSPYTLDEINQLYLNQYDKNWNKNLVKTNKRILVIAGIIVLSVVALGLFDIPPELSQHPVMASLVDAYHTARDIIGSHWFLYVPFCALVIFAGYKFFEYSDLSLLFDRKSPDLIYLEELYESKRAANASFV